MFVSGGLFLVIFALMKSRNELTKYSGKLSPIVFRL
jgi:hypothetical protein